MNRRAFTLVEMLVATFLVMVAVTGVMGGIRALAAADTKGREAELLQRLAMSKMNEIGVTISTTDTAGSGTFEAQGYPNITWVTSLTTTSTTNIDQLTVDVTGGGVKRTLKQLVYVKPISGSTQQ